MNGWRLPCQLTVAANVWILSTYKRGWAATVGRPEIQEFAGAFHGQHATKGIFITTSDFSRDALDYASKIGSKIVLIDGSRLAELHGQTDR
jgi:restriction system protein